MPGWVWLVGVAIVAAIVAAVVVLARGSGTASAAKVRETMLAAGCTYRDVTPLPPKSKNFGGYHADVPRLTTPINGLWNTFPPAAGGHYGLWAVWGFYTEPVNPRQVVHNEEHGAVVIWWGPKVPASTVRKLQAFYNEPIKGGAGDGMFGTPLDATIDGKSLGNKIALTAWTGDPSRYYRNGYYGIGHVAICPSFNQKAFATFRDAYRGKGPEGIPLADDQPGMGPTG
ncbi:MAG TPA: DUF3105 domain-containing protein [Gaiellaceae bacterium]|nr:DUF3105 domain-containing protein [Gaiellaceae bacterium]